MKKLFVVFCLIFLSACNSQNNIPKQEKVETILAPIEVAKSDYNNFRLNGKNYSLPIAYDDLKNNGIVINENEYFRKQINKNQQLMTNLLGVGVDIGATFKNTTNDLINTTDAKIIEIYVNSNNGNNQDFTIHGLKWGDSLQRARNLLEDINTDEAYSTNESTLNYYTDKNYVSLHFTNDKLTSAAIFSKAYMRDQNYVDGEFVIFGQTVKFPLTIKDLEDLFINNFDIDSDNQILYSGEELQISVFSPMYEDMEADEAEGVEVYLRNNTPYDISYKDANIVKLKATTTSDLSVGNIYVGASIDELKKMDKKNQNPKRLNFESKEDDLAKMVFNANNHTTYVFVTDDSEIKKIEVINK